MKKWELRTQDTVALKKDSYPTTADEEAPFPSDLSSIKSQLA
jgi:hypothetical protein